PAMAETRHLLRDGDGVKIWALDSASLVRPDDAGQIVLVGSHGGGPPANALKADCRAAIFNDAGIGIDGAGVARLTVLDGRGAAGFIGFHVSQALLARGDAVVAIDNLNDYYDVALKRARLAQLEGKPGFVFERADIADRAAMAGVVARHAGIDRVVHLAAQA